MCNREAPVVEQFARDHGTEVDVIGMGAQDSLDEARDFVDDHDTRSFTMLWDGSFGSWQHFGVFSQPTAILIAPDGTVLDGWAGMFPEDTVLEYAAGYT